MAERLIDADEARRRIIAFATGLHSEVLPVDTVVMLLIQMPPVDAVEVVRCRDCKHRGTDDCIFHINGEPSDEELLLKLDNDFCSYGERKDGDGNGKA